MTDLITSNSTPANGSNNAELARALGAVIDRSRLSSQFAPHGPADQFKAVAAWLEVFIIADVPTNAIDLCYAAAVRRRIAMINEGNAPFTLTAEFVAAQWSATVRDELDRLDTRPRLETRNPRSCPGCFGTGVAGKFDAAGKRIGSIPGKKCDHVIPGYNPNDHDDDD
jgi:hypothetical protein